MTKEALAALAGIAVVLSACAGGTPGKAEVQDAMNRYAEQNRFFFGDQKPIVKDTKCTKAGNDTYDCVTSLATTGDPEAHTITIKLTKLSGKWTAQITNLFG